MLYGVPQGSILGPLIFNIHISDMFYDTENCDIASYADGNAPYTSDFNLEEVMQKLELITNNLFEWFNKNHMKANAEKYHLVNTRDIDATAKIGEFDVKNSIEEKLLGVKTDTSLSSFARVANFTDLAKSKSLMKAFITSWFNYCPLIWIFHSRQSSNQIKKINEKALTLVHTDNILTFNELLELYNSVTTNQLNLQILATEIVKVKNNLTPDITTEVFEIKEPHYNLRSKTSHFQRENVKSTHYGI